MPILLEQALATLAAGSATVAVPGTGISQPGGLECTFQYNGLVMHDRRYIDKIRITKLDGFQDADIRDSREPNPADHGETAFEAWYGGKTMTIEGRIEAHNVNKLRDMQQALRYAFSGLRENPLYLLKASTIDYGADDIQINCRKLSPIQMSEQQTNGSNFYRDFQLILRASKPWFETINETQETINFGILDDFSSNSFAASSYAYDVGSGMVISGGSLYATTGSENKIYRSDLGYEPIDVRSTIKWATTATIAGFQFGHTLRRLSATVGIYCEMNALGASSYMNIYKQDSSLSLLATSAGFSLSASTYYWFRASANGNVIRAEHWPVDPFGSALSATVSLQTTLTGTDANLLGSGVYGDAGLRFVNTQNDIPFDDYRIEPLSLNHQVFTINNTGNFNARPKIRLSGPYYNAKITNEVYLEDDNAYRYMQIDGAISASTYYEMDVNNGTLEDVNGTNKFNQLNINSDDILLKPGLNYISITAASTFSAPRLDIFYRSTWI